MNPSLNIVLFGETGVGKSSVVNLIARQQIAKTSPDALGCTMSSEEYDCDIGGQILHIWDTVGLEEPEMGITGYLPAIEQAYGLICRLASHGGVDLLLFCIRGNRVTATTQSNYRLFYEVLCRSRVPIALVITHLERELEMENWWKRNQEDLKKYGIRVAGHACVTGLPRHSKYHESQKNIATLLKGYNDVGRFTMPKEGWLIEFLRLFGLFAPLKRGAGKKDIMKVLTERCGLDSTIAEPLAEKLEGGGITNPVM